MAKKPTGEKGPPSTGAARSRARPSRKPGTTARARSAGVKGKALATADKDEPAKTADAKMPATAGRKAASKPRKVRRPAAKQPKTLESIIAVPGPDTPSRAQSTSIEQSGSDPDKTLAEVAAPIDPGKKDLAPTSAAPEPVATKPAHDLDLPHGLSPVDLPIPADGEQPGLAWTARILILSSLLLVLFNSFAIDKWARALPVSEYSGRIIDSAAAWHGLMDRFDLNMPLETGRSAWHWLRDLRWPDAGDNHEAGRAEPSTAR